jgi:hypothetical protein
VSLDLQAAVQPLVFAFVFRSVLAALGTRRPLCGFWLATSAGQALASLLAPVPLIPVLLSVANIVLAAFFMWWRKRKDRKRALDAIGAKTRSLLDALLDRLRETLQSRPGLQPVPAGAGFKIQISAKGWQRWAA